MARLPPKGANLTWLVIISAILLAGFALFAAAVSPNPSDHRAAKILIAIAAAFVVLALSAPARITAGHLFRVHHSGGYRLQTANVVLASGRFGRHNCRTGQAQSSAQD
jgi:hypothetical protein